MKFQYLLYNFFAFLRYLRYFCTNSYSPTKKTAVKVVADEVAHKKGGQPPPLRQQSPRRKSPCRVRHASQDPTWIKHVFEKATLLINICACMAMGVFFRARLNTKIRTKNAQNKQKSAKRRGKERKRSAQPQSRSR